MEKENIENRVVGGSIIHLFDEKNNCIDYIYIRYKYSNGETVHQIKSTNSGNWSIEHMDKVLLYIKEDGNGLFLPEMGKHTNYGKSYELMLLMSMAFDCVPSGIKMLTEAYII